MVSIYYVAIKPQTDEHHAIHKEGCPFLPDYNKRINLGTCNCSTEALLEGQKYFGKSTRCRFCLNEHHIDKRQEEYSVSKNISYFPTDEQLTLSLKGYLFYLLN